MRTTATSASAGLLLIVLIYSSSVVTAAPFISNHVSSLSPKIHATKIHGQALVEPRRSLMDAFTISELLSFIGYQELAKGENEPITLESIYTWGDAMSQVRGQEFIRSEARDFFNQLDSNKDGEVSLAEWDEEDKMPSSIMDKMFEFTNVDTDDDREVSLPEFYRWARDYGKVIGDSDSESQMLNIFALKDMNQDGVIDRTEWSQFVDF